MSNVLIRVIDDDPDVIKSIAYLLESEGYQTFGYLSANEFLRQDNPNIKGCIILDLKMPEISGLELQQILSDQNYSHPIIFLTAHGDIEIAVMAMKKGAFDFLIKPVDPQKLLNTVEVAVQEDQENSVLINNSLLQKFEAITKKEKKVCQLVVLGLSNREIAEALQCGLRTVESHRSSIYKKLGINNSNQLTEILKSIPHLK